MWFTAAGMVNHAPRSAVAWPSVFVVVALIGAASIACSDADHEAATISEEEAREAGAEFLLASLGLFTGETEPQAFINMFAPECGQQANEAEIASVMAFLQSLAPEMMDAQIEGVEVGQVRLEQTAEGTLASLVDPDSLHITVDGESVRPSELFSKFGFETSGDEPNEPLLLVRRDGEILLGDCTQLDLFGQGSTQPAGVTTTSPSPTPTPAEPGASRSNPIPFGTSSVVEDTWQVTVLEVIPEAWLLIEGLSAFNEPPGPEQQLVMINVQVANVSDEDRPQDIDQLDFFLAASRDELLSQFDPEDTCGTTIPNQLDAELFPGGETQGNVCFRLPADETDLLLVWEDFFGRLTYFALE